MNHALLPSIGSASLPAKYEAAKLALEECSQLDECKNWANKSQALASYARQSKDKEMEKTAMRIRARAIRRCGELLKEVEKASNQHTARARAAEGPCRSGAAKDAGLSPRQAKDAVRVANVNGHSFEKQVESDDPPTVSALSKQGKTAPKGIPIYEKLGMTKKAFQAGMYFQGSVRDYLRETQKYPIQDIVDGSTQKDRLELKANLKLIDAYHQKLKAKL